MDANNPAVKLCIQGMEAETQGRRAEALEFYQKAWNDRLDGFEGAIAAHYIAKHQESLQAVFTWNKAALECALTIDDERVKELLPSLHLNLGKSYEDLGNKAEARRQYESGKMHADTLADDGLGHMIRDGLERGLKRAQE